MTTSIRTDGAAGRPVDAGPRATFTGSIRIKLRTPAKLRNLELGLLIFAVTLGAGAIMLVQFGTIGRLDVGFFLLCLPIVILVLVLHVALRLVAPDADPFVLPIAVLLNGVGIAQIHRIDIARRVEGWDAFAVRQTVWTAIALALAIAVLLVVRNHRVLQRYRYVAMFTGVVLLLLPLVPGLGRTVNGANVWIVLGPFSFQPGELAKIALAIFFAGYLVTARDTLSLVGRTILGIRFPRARDLGPILVIWAFSMAIIVFQRDLGTALLYFGLFLVMLYVATGRASWILIGLALFFGGAFAASQLLPYVGARFNAWLDAFNPDIYDQIGGSYQLVQGLFGLANGGLVGTGLGPWPPRHRAARRERLHHREPR